MILQDLVNQVIKTSNDILKHSGLNQEIQDMIDVLKDVSETVNELEAPDKTNLITDILTTVHDFFITKK